MAIFGCIYEQSVLSGKPAKGKSLLDLAFTFSPLIEQTSADTVVLNVEGQELLYGAALTDAKAAVAEIQCANNVVSAIERCAARMRLKINVAISANPDVAIHAARALKGMTIIPPGEEFAKLGTLPLTTIDYELIGIEKNRGEEIHDTLASWGVRTFSDFGKLSVTAIAQRLGQEGVRLHELVHGRTQRHLRLIEVPVSFEQKLELEHSLTELEPLAFILSRLLNQLCASLSSQALAANEVRLRMRLADRSEHTRTISLPIPIRNPKTLLRLLLLDIESKPPQSPISAVTISAEPAKPRMLQNGLFIPLTPEPEKLEVTLARLSKLVGAENVGSPELLNTHRPDAFRMKKFSIAAARQRVSSNPQSENCSSNCVVGFKRFRPPVHVEMQTVHGQPVRIKKQTGSIDTPISGRVMFVSGPWRSSGDWWRSDVWARDEWDIAVANSNSQSDDVLCRIYRDLTIDEWFIEGVYD